MDSCGRENEIQISIESAEACGNAWICLLSYRKDVHWIFVFTIQHCVYV